MTDDGKSVPSPAAPDIPSRGIPGGGVQPIPNPSGIPGKPAAGEGEDKGDLAPSPDQTLNDIKKGSR